MKAKQIITMLILSVLMVGCGKKDETKQVLGFKESVYGYMYSAQSMASFIADNIEKYESGMHYFDNYNGTANYSTGEYCEDVKVMVAIIRNHYEEQKSLEVIRSYGSEAKRLLPQGKADLEQLYRLAAEMDELATTSSLTNTYRHKYGLLIESFSTKFSVSDNTYKNTAVDYEKVKDGITRLQETLMGL